MPDTEVLEPALPDPPESESGGDADTQERTEDSLRAALRLPSLSQVDPPLRKRLGWLVTGGVTLLAAVLRLVGLGHPAGLMFDEIYYVKDAYSLWHNGYESQWREGADKLVEAGDFSALTTDPAFIVHPQLGKWLIAFGMQLMGTGPVGWRFAAALAGVLMVLLLARLTLRLTRSITLAGLAGFLLAIDGVAITESRIGLLDVFVGLFGLLCLYLVVRDRLWLRALLARRLAGTVAGTRLRLPLARPWLLAAGVSLGLTCSVKWTGIYLLAVVGLLVVVWDLTALRAVKAKRWLVPLALSAVSDFVHLVVVSAVVYVAGWWSWFLHPQAYKHGWAAAQRAAHGAAPRGWLPDSLNDLLEYHLVMFNFHVNLDADHPYKSDPLTWLLQLRPTSFYWPGEDGLREVGREHACGGSNCVEAITSVGNIPVWWAAFAALVVAVVVLVALRRDWRAWVPLAAYLGLYAPWFLYRQRTIFTFYTVSFVPEVVLLLVLVLGAASGLLPPLPGSDRPHSWPTWLRLSRPDPARTPIIPRPVADRPVDTARPRFDQTSSDGTVIIVPPRQPAPPAPVEVWQQEQEEIAQPLNRGGLVLTASVVVLATVFAVLWWPLWTGSNVSYDFWYWHMLLPSWI